ncbi:MAG: hypothetical protein A2Y04_04290 [Omnitrophica WOR_2 bacterium GWC2_45_7]|nr:MAG: hypothetical protein A2Y04_04290 [Omnitrophica WOR_2 bacterium GWC2_45_7]
MAAESTKLVKYFLATLTTPEKEMWVNLSPYEKNRIIPNQLGQTELGRDLLAQDYILKQLTASLIYPEDELGKKFWERVYAKAQEKYGSTDIPLNTFNKVWIVPNKAVVYENENNIFVLQSHLKVMLEEDYLALQQNKDSAKFGMNDLSTGETEVISGISSDVVREVLIPEIEKEVNEGKNFAKLRQIYNSMILATWYKVNLKESLLGQIYMDKNKTTGVDIADKDVKIKIYNQYLEAFKKGVFDYIREDYDAAAQEVLPRKYFSGGLLGVDKAQLTTIKGKDALKGVKVDPALITATNKYITTFDGYTVGEKADPAVLTNINKEGVLIPKSDKAILSQINRDVLDALKTIGKANYKGVSLERFMEARKIDKRKGTKELQNLMNVTKNVESYRDENGEEFYRVSPISIAVQIGPDVRPEDVPYASTVVINHSETREYLGVTAEMARKQAELFLKAGFNVIYPFGDFPERMWEGTKITNDYTALRNFTQNNIKLKATELYVSDKPVAQRTDFENRLDDFIRRMDGYLTIDFDAFKRESSLLLQAFGYSKDVREEEFAIKELRSLLKDRNKQRITDTPEFKQKIETGTFESLTSDTELKEMLTAWGYTKDDLSAPQKFALVELRNKIIEELSTQGEIEGQINVLYKGMPAEYMSRIYNPYEPVNGIKTTAIPDSLAQYRKEYIVKAIAKAVGVAETDVPLIYGGGANVKNIGGLTKKVGYVGAFIGRASAKAEAQEGEDSTANIVEAALRSGDELTVIFNGKQMDTPSAQKYLKAYEAKKLNLEGKVKVIHAVPMTDYRAWQKVLEGDESAASLFDIQPLDPNAKNYVDLVVEATDGVSTQGIGAYTAHLSAELLKKMGVTAAILDSSDPKRVQKQITNFIENGITPLVREDERVPGALLSALGGRYKSIIYKAGGNKTGELERLVKDYKESKNSVYLVIKMNKETTIAEVMKDINDLKQKHGDGIRHIHFGALPVKAQIRQTAVEMRKAMGDAATSDTAMVADKLTGRELYEALESEAGSNVVTMAVNIRTLLILPGMMQAAKKTGSVVIFQQALSEFGYTWPGGYKPENARLLADAVREAGERNQFTDYVLKGDHITVKVNDNFIKDQNAQDIVAGLFEDILKISGKSERAQAFLKATGDEVLKENENVANALKAIKKAYELVKAEVDAGFTVFALDASFMPTRLNVLITAFLDGFLPENASHEAEVGEIGDDANSTVADALEFVTGKRYQERLVKDEKTGAVISSELVLDNEGNPIVEKEGKGLLDYGVKIERLAINNGTSHGNTYDKEGNPIETQMNLQMTKAISDALKPYRIEIVQHGVTGTPLRNLPYLRAAGIRSAHVATHWQNIVWEQLVRVGEKDEQVQDLVNRIIDDLIVNSGKNYGVEKREGAEAKKLNKLIGKELKNIFGKFMGELEALPGWVKDRITAAIEASAIEHFKAFGSNGSAEMVRDYQKSRSQDTAMISQQNRVLRILDSRGNQTLKVKLWFNEKQGFGYVPSGASTGEREALEIRDDAFAKRVKTGQAEFAIKDTKGTVYLSEASVIKTLTDGKANTKEEAIDWLQKYSSKGTRVAALRAEFLIGQLEQAIWDKKVYPGLEGSIDDWLQKMEEQFGGNWELKNYFGANAILAISSAALRLTAALKGVEVFELNPGPQPVNDVIAQANILNGGEHADNNVDIQETMLVVVPDTQATGANAIRTEKEAIFVKAQLFQLLKKKLKKLGLNTNVGDEGGFAPNVPTNSDYLRIASEVVQESPWGNLIGKQIGFATDGAFSERSFIGKDGEITYWLEGERDKEGNVKPITIKAGDEEKLIGKIDKYEGRDVLVLNREELQLFWIDLVRRFPIVSLEDSFDQNDMKGHQGLTTFANQASLSGTPEYESLAFDMQRKMGIDTVGDDLLVTNLRQLKAAVRGETIEFAGKILTFPPHTINSILVKVNQVGSIKETKELIRLALLMGISVKISHRSGETEDTLIADLAKWATTLMEGRHSVTKRMPRVWIKTGSLSRSDRTAKYNRLIEIDGKLDRALMVEVNKNGLSELDQLIKSLESDGGQAGADRVERQGGINLDPTMLDMQILRDPDGKPLPVWQQPIKQINIQGVLPVLIEIKPIMNNMQIPMMLGFDDPRLFDSDYGQEQKSKPFNAAQDEKSTEQGYNLSLGPVERRLGYAEILA